MNDIREKIFAISSKYASELNNKIQDRKKEMKVDDKSHFLIYRVLGITDEEGELIDVYQNKGRFLYKYAGSFLEDVAILCFREKYPNCKIKQRIENTMGRRPKTFEIDVLNDNNAFEIKWRDATTDGDHITKEHTRAKVIKQAGYKPIRIMFYYPNRDQSIRIQDTIKTLYLGLNGEYYTMDKAWEYMKEYTDVDLKQILEEIAEKNVKKNS